VVGAEEEGISIDDSLEAIAGEEYVELGVTTSEVEYFEVRVDHVM